MVSFVSRIALTKKGLMGTSWVGQPGFLSNCVVGIVFIQDACLSGVCLDNQKLNVKHLYY